MNSATTNEHYLWLLSSVWILHYTRCLPRSSVCHYPVEFYLIFWISVNWCSNNSCLVHRSAHFSISTCACRVDDSADFFLKTWCQNLVASRIPNVTVNTSTTEGFLPLPSLPSSPPSRLTDLIAHRQWPEQRKRKRKSLDRPNPNHGMLTFSCLTTTQCWYLWAKGSHTWYHCLLLFLPRAMPNCHPLALRVHLLPDKQLRSPEITVSVKWNKRHCKLFNDVVDQEFKNVLYVQLHTILFRAWSCPTARQVPTNRRVSIKYQPVGDERKHEITITHAVLYGLLKQGGTGVSCSQGFSDQ